MEQQIQYPKYISFIPELYCNLRCKMCYYYGKKGTYLSGNLLKHRKSVPFSVWQQHLDIIARDCIQVEIFGGEPFFYKDIFGLLAYFVARKIETLIISSGWIVEKLSHRIIEASPDAIAISIDGTEKVHDAIRGKGSFSRAIRSLDALHQEKLKLHLKRPFVEIYCTITPYNYYNLYDFFTYLKNNSVHFDRLNVFLASCFTQDMLKEYSKIMLSKLNTAGVDAGKINMGWHTMDDYHNMALVVYGQYQKIIEEHDKCPFARIELAPLQKEKLLHFYNGINTLPENCQAPFYHLALLPNGDACFTTFFHDLILGNVFQEPFETIWLGEKAQKYRSLVSKKRFTFCKQCSQKYISDKQGIYNLTK